MDARSMILGLAAMAAGFAVGSAAWANPGSGQPVTCFEAMDCLALLGDPLSPGDTCEPVTQYGSPAPMIDPSATQNLDDRASDQLCGFIHRGGFL